MSQGNEDQWYYARAGQQQGPVSEGVLKRLLSTGQVFSADLVWKSGMAQWAPAGSVHALAPAPGAAGTAPAAPPPPPPYPPPYPSYGTTTAPLQYAAPPAAYATAGGIGQDPGVRWLLPVGRSGWAIAAGYLGLLSFVLVPAPLALIISIVAIMDIRKHPDRHGMGRAIFGLVMGILGTLVLCFVLLGSLASHSRY